MKQGIHPTYYKDAVVKCACGAEFLIGSTEKELHVEICSACHPFFTGKQKFLDAAGRVDKFRARVAAREKAEAEVKAKTAKTAPAKKETPSEQ